MSILTTLINFNGADGYIPASNLVTDAAGDIFGTTGEGGKYQLGTIFEIVKTSTGYADTPIVLYTFDGVDGGGPNGLTLDADGNLFGTTAVDGPNNYGTVFELAETSTGYASAPTVVVSFDGANGDQPRAGLVADAAGNLFGVTPYGGTTIGVSGPNNYGDGTVFEIAKTSTGYASTPNVLANFNGANGETPWGGLAIDAAGDLFGATDYGGPNGDGALYGGDGTLYEIVKTNAGYASAPTILANLDATDGGVNSTLTLDAAGDIFGESTGGGAYGFGAVFEFVKTAAGYASTPTILASFFSAVGNGPEGGLVIDAAGDLFGTTQDGPGTGLYAGLGTAFEIAKVNGAYVSTPINLADFNLANGGGADPFAGDIADANGNLLGTTGWGGTNGDGTLFELSSAGFRVAFPQSSGAVDLNTLAYSSADEAIWNSGNGALTIADAATGAAVAPSLYFAGDLSGLLVTLSSDGGSGTDVGAAPASFVSVATGDIVVSNVPGQSFSAYELLYLGNVFLGSDYFFTNVVGQSYSDYEYDYSAGNAFIGSKFYAASVTGQAYTGDEFDYDGGGNLTRAVFTGVTGAAYSAYEYDYVGGAYAGSKFTFTSVPQGATYSSYEVDYDQASHLAGEKFFFTNINGQPYSSLEEDFSAGIYTGCKAFYTVSGQTYASEEVDVSASNQLEKVIYSGMSATPYASVEQDFAGGVLADTIYSFNNVSGANCSAYHVEENVGGVAQQETLDLNSGGHAIIALTGGQTLTSLGDDDMEGSATGATNFVFNALYGADKIVNFTAADTISLPVSEFANFAALQAAATNSGGNLLIAAPDGDRLTLVGMDTTTLAGMAANFSFHG